jgi:hypothetical protein
MKSKLFVFVIVTLAGLLFSTKSMAYVAPDCTGPGATLQEIAYDILCGDLGTGSENEFCINNFDLDDDGIVNCSDRCRENAGTEDNDGCPVIMGYEPHLELVLSPHPELGDPPADSDSDGVNDETDDTHDSAEAAGGPGCSMAQNAGGSNVLSMIILALSLTPIAVRRSNVKK